MKISAPARAAALSIAAALTLSGCGGPADDLRDHLAAREAETHHVTAPLDGADIKVQDDGVYVFLDEPADWASAYLFCQWASEWAYDEHNVNLTDAVVIIQPDGREASSRQEKAAYCVDPAG